MNNTKVELGKLVKNLDASIKDLDDSQRFRFAQNLVVEIVKKMIDDGVDFDDNPGSVVLVKNFITSNLLKVD